MASWAEVIVAGKEQVVHGDPGAGEVLEGFNARNPFPGAEAAERVAKDSGRGRRFARANSQAAGGLFQGRQYQDQRDSALLPHGVHELPIDGRRQIDRRTLSGLGLQMSRAYWTIGEGVACQDQQV